jgi:CheY-like chemotaxis protein
MNLKSPTMMDVEHPTQESGSLTPSAATYTGLSFAGQLLHPREDPMAEESHLVLCVDDELIGLQVRRILLERAGYRVMTAQDGPLGLEVFEKEPVDLVVLDYSMPGMHGGEVATRMRQMKPAVPILLLSAYVGLPAEVTSLVDLYMTKGEGAEMLLTKIDSLLPRVPIS